MLVSVQIHLLPITLLSVFVMEGETPVITLFIPASLFIGVVSGLCLSACKALINNGYVCAGVSCMDCVTLSHVHTNPQGLDRASDGRLLHTVRPAHGCEEMLNYALRLTGASGDGWDTVCMCMCGECELWGSWRVLITHKGSQNEIYL